MSDLSLEYLIIYEKDGIPVYSRCFANICKRSMQDDVLFSAFLSSLETFSSLPDPKLDELDLNGSTVKVGYSDDDSISSLLIEDLRLVFYYAQNDKYTIAAGMNSDIYESENVETHMRGFLENVEEFMEGYNDVDWGYVGNDTIIEFETALLRDVVHPYFDLHNIEDNCPLGDNCPYRLAIYEGEGSIFDRLRAKIQEYREMNILRKMWRMMTSSPYKLLT